MSGALCLGSLPGQKLHPGGPRVPCWKYILDFIMLAFRRICRTLDLCQAMLNRVTAAVIAKKRQEGKSAYDSSSPNHGAEASLRFKTQQTKDSGNA